MSSDQSLADWLVDAAATAGGIADRLDIRLPAEEKDYPPLTSLAVDIADSPFRDLLPLLFPAKLTSSVDTTLSLRTVRRRATDASGGVRLGFTPTSIAWQVRHQHSDSGFHQLSISVVRDRAQFTSNNTTNDTSRGDTP